jgi:trans-aconitate methyltransferase
VTDLLDDDALERSSVVANCAMNRVRQLAGANSYTKELGFNPLDRLVAAVPTAEQVAWLDLCCGSGRPLLQAAEQAHRAGLADRVRIVGVDLVDHFDPVTSPSPVLELVCASITSWTPRRRFDLITCVHGLHYVGDKLGVLVRAASWLTDNGLLVADLDLASIHAGSGRAVAAALRRAGFDYDARRHRVSREGRIDASLPYLYLGADDRAGPNYTGQPAVDSYYEMIRSSHGA